MNLTKTTLGAKLQDSEEALRALMREATDLKAALDEHAIVVIADPLGRIAFVNEKFCAISKYSRADLLGQDHRVVISGQHSKQFLRRLWVTVARGKVWHGEVKNRAKDGSAYWVAATVVPSLDEFGRPWQFVAILADITEQKRIEAELAEKLRLQRLLVALSSRFVAMPSDHVDAAIEETQRLIVETLELDRSTLWQLAEHGSKMVLTHCWQRPGWEPLPSHYSTNGMLPWAKAKVMRGEIISFTSVNELPQAATRDDEIFRLHGPKSNVTIPLIAHGKVFGALAFSTLAAERIWREDEITELKLVAEIIGNVVGRQLAALGEEQLRGELAHAMRMATLGELAAALAHELNQPLAAILSNAQAARRFVAAGEIESGELRAILDDIVRDDKRAGNVIHNLRTMVSKRPALRERCCLNDLVCEVMELMNGELIGAKIAVRPKLAPSLPLVECARVELQQVLVNLLINAVHAMEDTQSESRFIEVETRAESNAAVVIVRDHGHGIPFVGLERLFYPFHSTKANGLGMGLSICRRIIENHGGRIEGCNHEEGGASFSFSLPVK
jgi:PAS domain S-box-containing protein